MYALKLEYVLVHTSFSLHLVQGSDYRVRDPTLWFGACAMRQCLTVDIIDNNLIEDAETFTLTLKHPPRGSTDDIVLDPTVATVTIEDEDGTFVGTIYLTFTLSLNFLCSCLCSGDCHF